MLEKNAPVRLFAFLDSPKDKTAPAHYRPDIDGLRALAILAVVIFHAFPSRLHGGFIGVDVFFVISGYLISGHILKEMREERFSFASFYGRRCRRIVPALSLVLAAVWAAGWLLLLPNEYKSLGQHILAGAGFSANLLLWKESGYFDVAGELKPLLHLWSLGIEEQFYITWPILLWLAARRRWDIAAPLFFVMGASLAANLSIAHTDKIADFYSPMARFWELGVGAILAWRQMTKLSEQDWNLAQGSPLPLRVQKLSAFLKHPAHRANVMAFAGLALLVAGSLVLNKKMSFPGWWALIPTAGAALLLQAGPKTFINRVFLSNRFMILIGLISYPLYLWHWPLLSFARIVLGQTPGMATRLELVALAFLLAWLTWRFVELPVRKNLFAHAAPRLRMKKMIAVSLLLLFILGGAGAAVFWGNGFSKRFAHFERAATDIGENSSDYIIAMKLNETICDPIRSGLDEDSVCKTNAKDRIRFALLGDSHAAHYIPGLMGPWTAQDGWLVLSHSGCPAVAHFDVVEKDIDRKCAAFNELSYKMLKAHPEIETAILSSMETPYFMGSAKGSPYVRDGHMAISSPVYHGSPEDMYEQGLAENIARYQALGKKVVLIVDDPEMPFDINACLGGRPLHPAARTMDSCAVSRAAYLERTKAFRQIMARLRAKFPSLLVYDPMDLFCDADRCSPWHGEHSLYRDVDHLSIWGGKYASRFFLRWLDANGFALSNEARDWADAPLN
jgi:peptidoglycan/LPS O-acetylase OafA/YrhL